MDHIINLPEHFRYVNEFMPSTRASSPSVLRDVTASVAMLMEIAFPGRWIPEELERDLSTQWAGASNQASPSKEQVLQWFHDVGVGYVDLAPMMGDQSTLKHVIQRMNDMNIPQLFTVTDESFLRRATDNAKLHSWNDKGVSGTFIRVGYSDNEGYGLYFEPGSPGFLQPVPISWQDSIEPAGLVSCIAVMPNGVAQPPENFDWMTGTWPVPPPVLNLSRAAEAVHALDVPLQALRNMADALDSNHLHTTADALIAAQKSILGDIGQ